MVPHDGGAPCWAGADDPPEAAWTAQRISIVKMKCDRGNASTETSRGLSYSQAEASAAEGGSGHPVCISGWAVHHREHHLGSQHGSCTLTLRSLTRLSLGAAGQGPTIVACNWEFRG
eukprot:COSAG03_NODE_52_length_16230_cov_22.987168_21_plen_117_part_00